jgi:hypothetical protein
MWKSATLEAATPSTHSLAAPRPSTHARCRRCSLNRESSGDRAYFTVSKQPTPGLSGESIVPEA